MSLLRATRLAQRLTWTQNPTAGQQEHSFQKQRRARVVMFDWSSATFWVSSTMSSSALLNSGNLVFLYCFQPAAVPYNGGRHAGTSGKFSKQHIRGRKQTLLELI